MNSEKLASIIVPIYKTEKYLDRCIESLCNQSYKNIEIILVDDGSPDRCGEIIDDWAKKVRQIHVIHKKNEGLSAARNAGLDICLGDYILFVDSDDFVEYRYVQFLIDSIEENGADISICREQAFTEGERIKHVMNDNYTLVNVENWDEHMALFSDEKSFKGLITWVWNKAYKRDIIEGIKFATGDIIEDTLFNVEVLKNRPRYVSIDDKLYHYNIRVDSVSANDKFMVRAAAHTELRCCDMMEKYYCALGKENTYSVYMLNKLVAGYCYSATHDFHDVRDDIWTIFVGEYKKYFKTIKMIKSKIKIWVARHLKAIYVLLYKIRKSEVW